MFKDEPLYEASDFVNQFPEQKKKGLLHTVLLSEKSHRDWQNVHAWCKDHTNDGTYRDNYSWNGSYFHFRDEDIAIQFRLIWG